LPPSSAAVVVTDAYIIFNVNLLWSCCLLSYINKTMLIYIQICIFFSIFI